MKILVNISNNLGVGGLQVALSFVNECRSFPQNEYHITTSDSAADQIEFNSFPGNFYFYRTGNSSSWKIAGKMRKIERRVKPDVVFTVFGPTYWRSKAPHVMGFANGHYLYPESPFWDIISPWKRWKINLQKSICKHYVNRDADAIICETTDATKRSSTLFDSAKKYFTISNSCNSIYFTPEKQVSVIKLPSREHNDFLFLYLSKYHSHKNFEQIPLVLENLIAKRIFNIKFVVTLDYVTYNRIFGKKYRDSVYNIGYTPIVECPALYKECDAAFLPSLLECFSVGYLEAMAMQKPIITSDLGFAHTTCRDSALYFDPLETDDIVRKVIQISSSKSLRNDLIKKGENRLKDIPTAHERAKGYLDICKMMSNVSK